MTGLADRWPAAGLRAWAGDLELRWIDDELLAALADLAAEGVHDPARMPFSFPWTRGTDEEVARSVLTYQWRTRGQVGPAGPIALEYAVLQAGRVVGVQGASGTDWSVLRSLETGSWLGRAFQGRGIGTRMRALVLHLLFDGLGAELVTSSAFEDDAASNAVSRRCGYEADGTARVSREGAAATMQRWALPRARWDEVRTGTAALLGAPVEIRGADALRAQLGAAVDPAPAIGG